jgi:serine/threonine protein kinase
MKRSTLLKKQCLTLRKSNLTNRLAQELSPFTIEDLPLDYSANTSFSDIYSFQRVLGAGGFGVVVSALECRYDRQWAIKIISKDLASEHQMQAIKFEAKLISNLTHDNIVHFYRTHESKYHQLIVMELTAGNLANLIDQRLEEHNPLSEKECRVIMKQIFEGLTYLHKNNILHRDLKPENILLLSFESLKDSVKIADFGLSTKLNEESWFNPTDKCGTFSYMAPEMLRQEKYSFVLLLSHNRQ